MMFLESTLMTIIAVCFGVVTFFILTCVHTHTHIHWLPFCSLSTKKTSLTLRELERVTKRRVKGKREGRMRPQRNSGMNCSSLRTIIISLSLGLFCVAVRY